MRSKSALDTADLADRYCDRKKGVRFRVFCPALFFWPHFEDEKKGLKFQFWWGKFFPRSGFILHPRGTVGIVEQPQS
jgi:hypothetical protein